MINELIAVVYFIGGFKLLFGSEKRYNIYLAVGFILYGIQFLLNTISLTSSVTELFFYLPKLLGSVCIFLSPFYYLRGEME